MSPFRPYHPEVEEPAPAGTTPRPRAELQAVRQAIVRHLRVKPAALSAQQAEYLVSFLAMAGEAEEAGGPGEPADSNALFHETL